MARTGDRFEVPIDGFVIDICRPRGDGFELIEIQTTSFGAMAKKLDHLLDDYKVQIVYPVAVDTYLVRPHLNSRADGGSTSQKTSERTNKVTGGRRDRKAPTRRKSPIHGNEFTVLDELISVPTLLDNPNFSVRVIYATVERIQISSPKARRGRGGWSTVDRRLQEIHFSQVLDKVDDLLALLPDDLPELFTSRDIANHGAIDIDAARKLAYLLRHNDRIVLVERKRTGYHYRLS